MDIPFGAQASPLIIGFIGSFFLLAVLTLTAYVKLSVVFLIIRNALGLQQVPSNMVLMLISLILSAFVSMPVFAKALEVISTSPHTATTPEGFLQLAEAGIAPFQAFLMKNMDPQKLDFFVQVAAELWQGSGLAATPDNFVIQVPAFLLTELTEAFEVGFLVYLPFVTIDLTVTGVLMALGMQMVQPNILSVPFKLLLFVFVDGWTKLVEGLVLSYGG